MTLIKTLRLFALFILFTGSSFASAPLETRLDNGLKVIIKQTNKPNITVAMIWYKVGSADEPGGLTGISHALEHMMFKGTPTYAPNDYSKLISKNGGQENAFTSKDYTAYFAKINSEKLPVFLTLEADRMVNLNLDGGEFAKEIKVVREERRMRTDDNPQALLHERFMALSHLTSPYHHPVVGWMDDLTHMTIEDIKHWYQKWYAPNNATVVIVSDQNPQKILALVKDKFFMLKARVLPLRKPQREPLGLGEKTLSIKPSVTANIPMLLIGFSTPSLVTTQDKWQPYELEVMAGILSGGNSARLAKELVRGKQSAIEASASYDMYDRYDNQFTLFGVVKSIHNIPTLKSDLLSQIQRLKSYLVSPIELTRIKNQVIASNIYSKDSVFGQAMELGMLETIGLSSKESIEYVEKIKQVTPKQIQDVARLYLTDNNMTSAVLIPNSASNNAINLRKKS